MRIWPKDEPQTKILIIGSLSSGNFPKKVLRIITFSGVGNIHNICLTIIAMKVKICYWISIVMVCHFQNNTKTTCQLIDFRYGKFIYEYSNV